ncbi:MAG: hypothetical protein BRD31_00160 [Bacteroidetes bacterium QH_2_64_26]|nr:MAG: hypothetical protein BRD31_00160 [Bacteroidetes bacterium QH_2_64_26]
MCTCRSAIWTLRAASGAAVVALLVFGPVGAVSDVPDGAAADTSPESAGVQSAAADSFRVQLYATTDRDAAESFRANARQWWTGVEREAPREVFGTNPPITIEQEGVYHRVRMGAFSSRAQARRAQSFLRRQYPDAFIVESAVPQEVLSDDVERPPTEEAPPSPQASGSKGPFRVQVYATTEREDAQSLRAEARQWWRGAQEQAPSGTFEDGPLLTIKQEGAYYRVQMGAFSTRDEARRARNFVNKKYSDAFIVQTGSAPEARPTQEVQALRSRAEQPPEFTTTEGEAQPSQRRETGAGRQQDLPDEESFSPAAAWGRIEETMQMVKDLSRDSVYTQRDLASLFDLGCSAIVPEEARADAFDVESGHLNREIGLDFDARYGQRTSSITDQTTGGLSGTFVGLEWDLLSRGFLGNRRRSDLLERRAQAERLTGELARIQRMETCRARRVQERFRGMVPRLLRAQIELGRYQERLLRQGYLEGEALLDTYLEVRGNVKEAERRLRILRDTVHQENDPPPLDAYPPLVDFDVEALTGTTVGDSLRRRLGKVERQAIDLEDNAAFDTRFSVFSRYTATRTLDNRDLEFGFRFSQPLFGALFGNDEVAEKERTELRRREEQRFLSERRSGLRTVYRRYEEDQSLAIRSHYRVSSRRERMRQRLGARSVRANDRLNEALRDARNLLQAMIEKALAYGEAYEEVARAFAAAREPFDPSYLSVHPVSRYEQRGRAGQRSLYIWSEAMRTHSNDFIIELARARKIQRLIVSAGQNTPMQKVRALQRQARDNDIATELLLASNHWVEPGGTERARTRISNLDLRGSALHLDVEPHMFDDFDQREDEYLRRYLEVLRAARRTIGDEKELVVSIPLFWPDRVYQEIATIVDRAHFMAYGDRETRQRASRTLEVARYFSSDQRVVALRPEDFTNPWTLDQAISTLQKVVQAEQFAIHDLESFLEFIRDEP